MEATQPVVKRYGKPKSTMDTATPGPVANTQKTELKGSSPGFSFGSSALFGGMTAKDNTSESENDDDDENDDVDISLDEIKRRYLNKGINSQTQDATPTQNVLQPKTQTQTQTQIIGNDHEETQDQDSSETQPVGGSISVETQQVGASTGVVSAATQLVTENPGNVSMDTVDMLSPNSPKPVAQQVDGDGVESDDSDDDIIRHKKRSHNHVLSLEDEEEGQKSDSNADSENDKQDNSPVKRQKTKKMSKKDLEETEKEARRQERGLELAPEARTNKKITVEGFLDMFEKPTQREASDISPHKSSEENSTPNTSPPSAKANKIVEDPFKSPGVTASKKIDQPPSNSKDPNKFLTRTDFLTPRRLASFMKSTGRVNEDDSDDDLEIVPMTKAATAPNSMKKLVQLAHVNPFKEKKKAPTSIQKVNKQTLRSMIGSITAKQREQAMKDREEKIAEYKARGGILLEKEDMEKEDEMVESLLERERRKAEELRKQEQNEEDYDDEEDADFVDEADDADDDDQEALEPEDPIDEQDDVLGSPVKQELANDEKDEFDDLDEDEDQPSVIESSQNGSQVNEFDFPEPTQLSQYPNPTQTPEKVQAVEEQDSDVDGDDGLIKVRRRLMKPPKAKKPKVKYDKKNSLARGVVDDEAQESDDEWAGLGGASDDEEDVDSYNLENLVDDNSGEKANETENQELFAQNELEQDEKMVNKLMVDVKGGFRRRQNTGAGGLIDLSDDDDYEDYEHERLRREEMKRMRLLEDEKISDIAKNPKAQAFVDSIADKSSTRSILEEPERKPQLSEQDVRNSLSFLDGDDGDDVDSTVDAEVAPVAADNEPESAARTTTTTINGRAIDRISERKQHMARARSSDVVNLRRSVASMNAKFKAEKGKKDVEVLKSLSGPAFNGGASGKSASVVSKRVLTPAILKKERVIPKSSSVGSGLFKKGDWN